jgi:uncharacterized damage-inducible protein DinB
MLDPARLAAKVTYTSTEGETYTNTVADIVSQVVTHGAHHRGQIIAALRAAGHTPPLLDFIYAVRIGQVP